MLNKSNVDITACSGLVISSWPSEEALSESFGCLIELKGERKTEARVNVR